MKKTKPTRKENLIKDLEVHLKHGITASEYRKIEGITRQYFYELTHGNPNLKRLRELFMEKALKKISTISKSDRRFTKVK